MADLFCSEHGWHAGRALGVEFGFTTHLVVKSSQTKISIPPLLLKAMDPHQNFDHLM